MLCCSSQINLKPSAVKNDLNAIIHFVKFLKLSRNLAATDPQMLLSLQNLVDSVERIQRGTLKKINLDRSKKTVRNIQEGLPFSVQDAERICNDPKLVKRV